MSSDTKSKAKHQTRERKVPLPPPAFWSPGRGVCRAASMLLWRAAGSCEPANSLSCAACLPWTSAWPISSMTPAVYQLYGFTTWKFLKSTKLLRFSSPSLCFSHLQPISQLCLDHTLRFWAHLCLPDQTGSNKDRLIDLPFWERGQRKSACCRLDLHVNQKRKVWPLWGLVPLAAFTANLRHHHCSLGPHTSPPSLTFLLGYRGTLVWLPESLTERPGAGLVSCLSIAAIQCRVFWLVTSTHRGMADSKMGSSEPAGVTGQEC